MIIYNTTFHVDTSVKDDFVEYMLQTYIPAATKSGELSHPRLTEILGKADEEGTSFAIEFSVANLLVLEEWNKSAHALVIEPLLQTFQTKIAGFSTLMKRIEY